MRKLEQEMLTAIREGRDWRKDNTKVLWVSINYCAIYLHGNHLGNYIRFSQRYIHNPNTLDKWPTRTTKSRIKALETLNEV